MSTDVRSANLRGSVAENKGAFLFFLAKNHSKKTIQMDFFKNIFAKKWAFFWFYGGKNFFLWRRARRGIGVCGLLRGVPGRLRCACGWMRGVPGACGWMRWRLCMFNLICHFLLENHKLSRCSSGRVSVDSAAFFGYKFGYKILNSRKPSGSAGAKQLTNNLRMDAMDSPDIVRSCARHMARAWMGVPGRVRLECRRALAAIWARCFPSEPSAIPRGGGASGKFTGGIAIQYIFARKNFGILANDNKRIKTNRAIGRISHIVVRWLRQGTVFTAPLIFSRG